MPGISLHVEGVTNAVAYANGFVRGVERMSRTRVYVGSRRGYAYGMHEGRFKSGRLARRRGGTYYLQRAVNTVLSGADTDISAGLDLVKYPGPWILRRLGRWGKRLARLNVQVVSGRLQRSIIVVSEGA